MNMQSLQKDNVFIEKADASRIGPFQTTVSDGSAIIYDATLDVNDHEILVRPLPNGKEERYLILSAEYSPRRLSISAHFNLKLQKTTAVQPAVPRHTTVNINHSSGIQVGDHNVVNIQNALNELVQRIETAQASPSEKAEAQNRLSSFLAHPLVCSVLGGIAGGLAGGAGS